MAEPLDPPPRRSRRPARRRRGIPAFLLASVVPLGAAVWFLLQPPDRREAALSKIPSGVGGRAIAAGIAFGVLLLLARVALPAFHGASEGILAARARIRSLALPLRVLLAPVQGLLWFVWFLFQLLFAVDAFLVVASALVGLLLVVRIVSPGFLPDVLPDFPTGPGR